MAEPTYLWGALIATFIRTEETRGGEDGVYLICSVGFLRQGSGCSPPGCPGTCSAHLTTDHLLLPPGAGIEGLLPAGLPCLSQTKKAIS